MIKKSFFTLFTILFFTTDYSMGCTITSFERIIKINKILDQSIIKGSDCSDEINEEFISLVSNANGKLNHSFLTLYFKNQFKKTINLSPKAIDVIHINDFVGQNLSIPDNYIVSNTTSMFGKASLNLSKSKLIKVKCSQCSKPGERNIKLVIDKKVHWLTSHILVKRRAFVLNTEIRTLNTRLTPEFFKEIIVTDKGNHFLFSDIENISFYRFNRNLNVGDVLKKNALVPRVLVRAGQKVKLLINNERVKLKTSAIARKNGRIGDYIDVINPKSNKKTLAKVVDFNTAVVDI
jgi:flagella basal body P-ring formation protein FlgA